MGNWREKPERRAGESVADHYKPSWAHSGPEYGGVEAFNWAGRAEQSGQIEKGESKGSAAGSEASLTCLICCPSHWQPQPQQELSTNATHWAEGRNWDTQPSNREARKETEDGLMLSSAEWTDSVFPMILSVRDALLLIRILVYSISNLFRFVSQAAWIRIFETYQFFNKQIVCIFEQFHSYCTSLVRMVGESVGDWGKKEERSSSSNGGSDWGGKTVHAALRLRGPFPLY